MSGFWAVFLQTHLRPMGEVGLQGEIVPWDGFIPWGTLCLPLHFSKQ
jgi:hypothetical protein